MFDVGGKREGFRLRFPQECWMFVQTEKVQRKLNDPRLRTLEI